MTGAPLAQNTAITIGNFDGVHVGHAALVQAARAAADSDGNRGRVVALTFDPNPITVLRPDVAPPARLSSFAQRTRWLNEAGADEVIALKPTVEFLRQTPTEFIQSCVDRWKPAFIVEGNDFHFGKGRAGTIETLREHETRFGFRTIIVDPVEVALGDQSIVRASSSLVRWLIAHGRVSDAARVLEREYEIEAKVVRGDQRGRTIGFPTANLGGVEQLLPADGIYAGVAERDGQRSVAAISVGTKPTFGEHPRTCEAHLLDYDGPAPRPPMDDYGWTIRLRFTHWLRDQLRYDGVQPLIEQLHRDVAQTRRLLNTVPGTEVPGPERTHATAVHA